jgi:transposase
LTIEIGGAKNVASFFPTLGGLDGVRYMITDDLWATLGPTVRRAKRYTCGQPPILHDRMFLEAHLYWARTGIPWRDLPDVFGAWDAVYHRFRRWVGSATLMALFEVLTTDPAFGEVRRVLLDSTIVRAHAHAAGAPRTAKRIGAARSAAAQGLGRSRGGFTTKVVLTAADEDTAVAVEVLPGQANDTPRLEPRLRRTAARVPGIDELTGDAGFDGDAQREACLDRGIFPNIPNRKTRVDPWPFDPAGYKERNWVERLFGKLKEFRRAATRYDKRKRMFLGWVQLILGFIRLKRLMRTTIVNTA